MSSEKFGKSSVGDGRESWTTEPTVQPTLEIINSLATACVLKKKKWKISTKRWKRMKSMSSMNLNSLLWTSRFFHGHGAQKYTKCAHTQHTGSLRECQGGRGKLRGERHGGNIPPTSPSCLKLGQGLWQQQKSLLLLSSKIHHLVHILQSCCKLAHYSTWKKSREEMTETVA